MAKKEKQQQWNIGTNAYFYTFSYAAEMKTTLIDIFDPDLVGFICLLINIEILGQENQKPGYIYSVLHAQFLRKL